MSPIAIQETEPAAPAETAVADQSVVSDLAKRTSALAMGTLIERGLGFLANVVAARVGGASVFGAYSVAMTTANTIASYAAGGIGSTATRYAAQCPRHSSDYPALVKALAAISAVSALAAVALLYSTAELVAGPWLHNPGLAPALRLASFSAGGIILLECCRGFFIGQRKLAALILLSAVAGGGMIAALPIASHFGAQAMIAVQASVALGAVAVCVLLAGRLGLRPLNPMGNAAFRPMLRKVWHFGLVQLAGLVALNLGGWWLTSLVARSDSTLRQVALFSISLQLRNLVSLAPALLSESALALMVDSRVSKETPGRVLAICTFASVAATLLLAGAGILVAPWLLPMVYGQAYRAAVLPATLALATAVIHMGSAPASARTTVLSIRYWGWTNAAWAVFVTVFATLLVPKGGAPAGMVVYLGAQALVAVLLFAGLRMRGESPRGVISTYGCGSAAILIVAGLGYARFANPAVAGIATLAMAFVLVVSAWLLFAMGRRNGVAPGPREITRMLLHVRSRVLPGVAPCR